MPAFRVVVVAASADRESRFFDVQVTPLADPAGKSPAASTKNCRPPTRS
jgi:hypothetical protein